MASEKKTVKPAGEGGSEKQLASPQSPAREKKQVEEYRYPLDELVANYKALNAAREIVAVALRMAGKSEYSLAEAQKIVSEFASRR